MTCARGTRPTACLKACAPAALPRSDRAPSGRAVVGRRSAGAPEISCADHKGDGAVSALAEQPSNRRAQTSEPQPQSPLAHRPYEAVERDRPRQPPSSRAWGRPIAIMTSSNPKAVPQRRRLAVAPSGHRSPPRHSRPGLPLLTRHTSSSPSLVPGVPGEKPSMGALFCGAVGRREVPQTETRRSRRSQGKRGTQRREENDMVTQ